MDPALTFYTTYLAAVYNCDAYGTSEYDVGGECATGTGGGTTGGGTTTTTGTATGGSLVDTGSPVFYMLTGGILLVVVALAILSYTFIRRKRAAK